jgi:DNA repair protein RadC
MMEKELVELPLGRILGRGPAALTDGELLSVLLRQAPTEAPATQEKAEALLARFGGVSGLGACGLKIVRGFDLGEQQKANLLAAAELSRRLHAKLQKADLVGNKEKTAAYLAAHFGRPGQHVLGALFVGFDEENLGIVETFRGTTRDIRIDTKTILREALCRDATGIFMFHIFPRTKTEVSGEDARFGKQMLEAGELVGIELIDYLLIGPKSSQSLRKKRPW